MRLSELQTGEKGVIVKVMGRGVFHKRLIEMGFVKGKVVEVLLNAPLKDPVKYRVMGYEVSLRRSEAELIEVVAESEVVEEILPKQESFQYDSYEEVMREVALDRGRIINVALVGNPNSGKTTLFNEASGAHEHVGNYGGVTVDAKAGKLKHKGYVINIVDLPGTYSLSAYSPEELFVRKHIRDQAPDVIINVVAASNLERNLLLTTQLIDMDMRTVVALNMYDELEESGDQLDHDQLATLFGMPIVPVVSKKGWGIEQLFDEVIDVFEGHSSVARHIHIFYGDILERAIYKLSEELKGDPSVSPGIAKRYLAIKLLEQDAEVERYVESLDHGEALLKLRDEQVEHSERMLGEDCETAINDARYGFIEGALRETYEENQDEQRYSRTRQIDAIVTHKYFGFPIFFFFMWLMFEATFRLGSYPQEWIEQGVGLLGDWVKTGMSDGMLKDLVADGIIGGVGSVIVFLPNIVILYLFISFMEDSGYMARAAFIMDKLMHRIGLHGKSFIPLVMGFGCNVPAIMATRTIESRNSRMITMLILPLMSCNARLPIYVLLIGAFFASYASWMLLGIYTFGILLSIVVAKLLKRFAFREDDLPFVMELPPYRTPTLKSVLIHMWEKAAQYLRKMGGLILIASIIIWFLSYFPRNVEYSRDYDALIAQAEQATAVDEAYVGDLKAVQNMERQEASYIGQLGHFVEPAIRPLGFDWKIGVSLVSGMAAKEVVVSTMGVLYAGNSEESVASLSEKLYAAKDRNGDRVFTPLVALGLMLFSLIYFPCVATIVAVRREANSWLWALFIVVYTTALAWIVAFLVYQLGSLMGY